MAIFKTRTKKLKERLRSLEEHLGVVYDDDPGYPEHHNKRYGELPSLIEDVKALKAKAKK